MKETDERVNSLRTFGTGTPIPIETLRTWLSEAEQRGFDAVLPLIEREGTDVIRRALDDSVIGWLFLAGVARRRRALLIGSDLGAPVEALKSLFRELIVIEPDPSLLRLLQFRFHEEVTEGRIQFREAGPHPTDVDLDLIWLMPRIGRSPGCLPLSKELRGLLRDCTTRLSESGLLVFTAVRDRGLLRNIPLPGIRHELGQGYSLREFEQIFESLDNEQRPSLKFYWLVTKPDGRTFGADLVSSEVISYCLRTNSRRFRFMGPLSHLGANFVTKRVSSVMVTFRRDLELLERPKSVRKTGQKTAKPECLMQRVLQTIKEQYDERGQLAPLFHRSGNQRRTGCAIYLITESKSGRPLYVVRIAKGPASTQNLRQEGKAYRVLQETNRALKNLEPVYYFTSDRAGTSRLSATTSLNGHDYEVDSFSVQRYVEGISAKFFRQKSLLDTSSLDWLKCFQKESSIVLGTFNNSHLSMELGLVQDGILKDITKSLSNGTNARILTSGVPREILNPLFADLDARLRYLEQFSLPLTPVHGDYCPANILVYREKGNHSEKVFDTAESAFQPSEARHIKSQDKLGIHVFDWELVEAAGSPLFDPWMYVIGFVSSYIEQNGGGKVICDFLTGRWKYSSRVEKCLAYYLNFSKVPVDLLVGYLPLAVLKLYLRELSLSISHAGMVQMFEEFITSLAANRREVWNYLDTLGERIRKEIQQ